jgi:hypothetical protein
MIERKGKRIPSLFSAIRERKKNWLKVRLGLVLIFVVLFSSCC